MIDLVIACFCVAVVLIREVGGVQRSVWVLVILIDRDNGVESSEIIESRVSRSLFLWTRTCLVSSIGIDPLVFLSKM